MRSIYIFLIMTVLVSKITFVRLNFLLIETAENNTGGKLLPTKTTTNDTGDYFDPFGGSGGFFAQVNCGDRQEMNCWFCGHTASQCNGDCQWNDAFRECVVKPDKDVVSGAPKDEGGYEQPKPGAPQQPGPPEHPQVLKIRVYYESLCPDSAAFISKQLKPAWDKLKGDKLQVTFIPFGKAFVLLVIFIYKSQCSNNVKNDNDIEFGFEKGEEKPSVEPT